MNKVELVISLPWFACLGFAYSLSEEKKRERGREARKEQAAVGRGAVLRERRETEENPCHCPWVSSH